MGGEGEEPQPAFVKTMYTHTKSKNAKTNPPLLMMKTRKTAKARSKKKKTVKTSKKIRTFQHCLPTVHTPNPLLPTTLCTSANGPLGPPKSKSSRFRCRR